MSEKRFRGRSSCLTSNSIVTKLVAILERFARTNHQATQCLTDTVVTTSEGQTEMNLLGYVVHNVITSASTFQTKWRVSES